jgi:hypothetical protein
MKFSGKGPVIHQTLQTEFSGAGQQVELFNDKGADYPYPEDSESYPKVGQDCGAPTCEHKLLENELAYLTIETDDWVCWRHIQGMAGPARNQPE